MRFWQRANLLSQFAMHPIFAELTGTRQEYSNAYDNSIFNW